MGDEHLHADLPISLDDFDFHLPPGQIAFEPVRPRDRSRLLVSDRSSGTLTDSSFLDLAEHLKRGDLLVLNNTRVLKARVLGSLERTGRRIEVLFANPVEGRTWEVMLHPARRIRQGDRIRVDGDRDDICLKVGLRREFGLREATLESPPGLDVGELLSAHGHVPLPPYIDRKDNVCDRTEYQTVFARNAGAIAAPTAGLHFSDAVFDRLAQRGVEIAEITLHVGIGTFVPVRTSDARAHRLKGERFNISDQAAHALNRARRERRRIAAVGTTTTRTIEYVFGRYGEFLAVQGETDLYIVPGYPFRATDALITNFHLPRSTLLLLVCAFAGRDNVLTAYRHAVEAGYRFYSYGDAMLFL